MKKRVLISISLLSISFLAHTAEQKSVQKIEQEWAIVHYNTAKEQQIEQYQKLVEQTEQLLQANPNHAETLFCLAMIKASMAEHEDPVSALTQVQEAKDLLTKVIELEPKVMRGAAYVILGTLYHRVPQWPISFGDNQQAEKFLKTALNINPNGIDSNYFYGKFLLALNKVTEAKQYIEKALNAPAQSYADQQLKEEAKALLHSLEEQKAEAKS